MEMSSMKTMPDFIVAGDVLPQRISQGFLSPNHAAKRYSRGHKEASHNNNHNARDLDLTYDHLHERNN